MAKSYRTYKLEFWTDPDLCRLPPVYTIVYGTILNMVDDEGRIEDDPRQIWQRGFSLRVGFDPVLLHQYLDVLMEIGKIVRYCNNGQHTIAVCTWENNQKVPHPLPSKLPMPSKQLLQEAYHRRRSSRVRLFTKQPALLPTDKTTSAPGVFLETSRNFIPEGKGGPCPSDSKESSVQGSVSATNAASQPFEERHPEKFKELWKRTQNAIRRYESLVPIGKPVTPEEALEFQEAIGKARKSGGPHLAAVEHYARNAYEQFASEGIMYAGKPLGQGQFGRKSGHKPKQPTSDRPYTRSDE